MSKSKAIGTKLKLNEKLVGGLTSVNGIDITAETIDVTDLANDDGYREKLAGLKDAGEITVSGFLDGDDEGQNECYTLLESGEVVAGEIVFPAKIGKTWSFNGAVTKFTTGAEVANAVTFEATIAVSGKPTLATTAAAG